MARQVGSGQNKSSKRNKLRSALAAKSIADAMLEGIIQSQESFNDLCDKLEADSAVALDTDYEADLSMPSPFEADEDKEGDPYKASMRKAMQSALSHRRLANEMCDSVEEFQSAFEALLVKLDGEAGTLASTDFEADLGLSPIDSDAEGEDAQHKSSLRKSLRSALAESHLADDLMDAISGMQEAMNSVLAELDAGSTSCAQFKVSVLDADSEG